MKSLYRLAVAFVLSAITGCAVPQIWPNGETRRSFADLDQIQIEAVGETVVINDQQVIDRIGRAYRRSKWDPMPTTMPIDLVTIYGVRKGRQEFKLLFAAGWIIDTDPESGKVERLGRLSEEDREWMHENIRLRLPRNPGII